jgi:choline-glycine betaine transporter
MLALDLQVLRHHRGGVLGRGVLGRGRGALRRAGRVLGLLGGGLQALQTAAITTGLPIAAILLLLCYTLYRGLATERIPTHAEEAGPESAARRMGLETRAVADGDSTSHHGST